MRTVKKKTIRKWRPIAEIARLTVDAYLSAGNDYGAATEALAAFLLTERKISRLTEQLKDAIVDGGLDDPAVIRELFRDIYKAATLRGIDEEGRPLAM